MTKKNVLIIIIQVYKDHDEDDYMDIVQDANIEFGEGEDEDEIIKSEITENCKICGKSMKSIGFTEEGENGGRK